MRLTAPLYRLKRRAKTLARERSLPLHRALDQVAESQGFKSWSLLAAKASARSPARRLFAQLSAGDLVLLAARPGHGKTALGLELTREAILAGRRGLFFTLEYSDRDVLAQIRTLGGDVTAFAAKLEVDSSDAIQADYVMDRLAAAPRGTLAVIDYLQLLDQRRETPDLMTQVTALKRFAQDRGAIFLFISQIDRAYDSGQRPCPGLEDVRLPNPLDLGLFDKACFLQNGEIKVQHVP
ncbi:MAG: DNA helicase [Rhodospirillales bacterium]